MLKVRTLEILKIKFLEKNNLNYSGKSCLLIYLKAFYLLKRRKDVGKMEEITKINVDIEQMYILDI